MSKTKLNDKQSQFYETKVKSNPYGALAIHVKRVHSIRISKKFKYLMIRTTGNDDMPKDSKIVSISSNRDCLIDELKHFTIKLNDIKKIFIKVEIIAFKNLNRTLNEDDFMSIAHHYLNVNELAESVHIDEDFRMYRKYRLAALLNLEICCLYGCFGYGFSNQLYLSDCKDDVSNEAQENLLHTMFQRVAPPSYRYIK
jgi:hypothetical protein